jgi:hypothetical protein
MILDNDQSEAMILKVDPSEIQAIHRIPGNYIIKKKNVNKLTVY